MFHLMNAPDHDLEQGVSKKNSKPTQPLLLVCTFPFAFLPRDDLTANDLPAIRQQFYRENTTDVNQDKQEPHSLVFQSGRYLPQAMVVLHPDGAGKGTERPWWCRRRYYNLSTFFFASILYRKFLF